MADHFQYLASLPMIAALSAGLVIVARRVRPAMYRGELFLAAVIGVALGVLTWQQSRNYRDAETLFRATLARNPRCWRCYNF